MSALNSDSTHTRSTIASAMANRTSSVASISSASMTLKGQNIEPSSLSALQSSLQKAMEEMGRVSTIPECLELDVSQVKQSQMDMQEDVSVILQRLDEAVIQVSMREDDNDRLIKKAEKNAKLYEDLHRTVQDAANRDRHLILRLLVVK